MLVKEVMTPHVVSIAPEESAALAARLLARHGLGALPVCSAEGILRGMVTDRDIVLRCVAPEADPKSVPVKEIMSRRLAAVAPGDDVRQAARLMARRQSPSAAGGGGRKSRGHGVPGRPGPVRTV